MNRYALLDALKVIASQLIVFHHFANYGPLSDALEDANLLLSDWLYEYGRMAVQVFMVMGGFLAVKSLGPDGHYRGQPLLRQMVQRYWRLAPPFVVAMLLASVVAGLVRWGLPYHFIPGEPTWSQVAWHALLLHTVAHADAMSAGAWYVAMDFQMYLLVALLLWAGGIWGRWGVVALTLASAFIFNRNTEWDNQPWYFFGAYGMGALAYWVGSQARYRQGLVGLAALGALALALDFRGRLLVAWLTALALVEMQRRATQAQPLPLASTKTKAIAGPVTLRTNITRMLVRASYALFLVHFSVLMVANLAWEQSVTVRALGLGWTAAVYWLCAMALALLFERWIERPLARGLSLR